MGQVKLINYCSEGMRYIKYNLLTICEKMEQLVVGEDEAQRIQIVCEKRCKAKYKSRSILPIAKQRCEVHNTWMGFGVF